MAVVSEFIHTYIHGLDEKIERGIPRGDVLLISGSPGSYKSSIAFYMAYKNMLMKKEGSVLYFSLNQPKDSLLFQMDEMNLSLEDLPEGVHFEIVNSEILKGHNIRSLKDFYEVIKKFANDLKNLEFIVVDTLNILYIFALYLIENPHRELFEFFENLRKLGATVILISETPMDTSKISQFEIEAQLSDAIFHLSMERIGRTLGRYISVVKLRGRKHSTDYYPIIFDDLGFRILSR